MIHVSRESKSVYEEMKLSDALLCLQSMPEMERNSEILLEDESRHVSSYINE